MDKTDIEDIEAGSANRHIVAAGLACVVSLLIHAVLGIMAAKVDFLGFTGPSNRPSMPRKYEAINMADTTLSDDLQDRVLDELRKATVDNSGLVREMDDLAVAPDEGLTEPLSVTDEHFLGEDANIAEPSATPSREILDSKHEIIAIENKIVAVEPPNLPRRIVPKIERIGEAPEIKSPASVDLVDMFSTSERSVFSDGQPKRAAITRPVVTVKKNTTENVEKAGDIAKTVEPPAEKELFEEKPEDVTDFKPIERILIADIETYAGLRDFRYGYFKITIERVGKELLPVIPKDILLLQDCSASMSERRLYFCRQGLEKSLALIGPQDRFNVGSFKENTKTCFPDWSKNTPSALKKAAEFIGKMNAGGNTDLCTSMVDMLSVKRKPGRPVVAIVITDGLANKGLTDSSSIISEFSKQNKGNISVFTMGTIKTANTYLLDLISYCNNGSVSVVTKGRWDIPDNTVRIMESIGRPVLADLRFRFAETDECEVYPVQTGNLYLDRPLELYGRYRKRLDKIVFQAVGQAGDTKSDLLFALPIGEKAKSKDKTIRSMWAKQKIYHLIAEYARTASDTVYDELIKTSRAYNERIPYIKKLGK